MTRDPTLEIPDAVMVQRMLSTLNERAEGRMGSPLTTIYEITRNLPRCAPGSARWRTWYDEPGESSSRRSATCWRWCGSRAMITVQPAGQV